MNQIDYIEYLKSQSNEKIEESISDFFNKKISFNQLEEIAMENDYFSKYSYIKSLKLDKIIK